MCSLGDLQLLECEPSASQGAPTVEPKFAHENRLSAERQRIVVVPDEWIVDCIPALSNDTHLRASCLTGFARFELVRLGWTFPDAMLIRPSSFSNAPQPYSYDIPQPSASVAV